MEAKMTQTAATARDESRARGGSHDWHDAEYVRQWVEENEARIEGRRSQFDLIADFIPHTPDSPISILDVGAGWGPVTRHLLSRFPNAHVTLFDYSDQMFSQARAHLAPFADRVVFVIGDLSHPGALSGALEEAGGPFDAIVSSSCIHNVRPTERIPVLYAEMHRATAPGGCFLNLDMVGSAGLELDAAWRHARVEQFRRRRQAETGTLPSRRLRQRLKRSVDNAPRGTPVTAAPSLPSLRSPPAAVKRARSQTI
jgi:SAM-dependent methyltransferase